MNNQKFFAPAILLILGIVVGGSFLYWNLGSSSSQIARVTPVNSPLRATMPFLSPMVVPATVEPASQVVVAAAPTVDISSLLNLTVPITSSANANSGAAFTGAQVSAPQGNPASDQQAAVSNVPQPHGIPTPIPADGDLERGEALRQMREIDTVWEVEAPTELTFEEDPIPLVLTEFFNDDFDPWTGTPPTLTDKLLALDGKMVELKGYMAPPLKLGLDWFLLTDFPVGFCPYHSSAGSITAGMALIYVEGEEYSFAPDPLSIVGELHVGELADPETGMVSIARVYTQKEDITALTLGQQ